MDASETPRRADEQVGASRTFRALLAIAAVAAAAAAFAQARAWSVEQRRLAAFLEAAEPLALPTGLADEVRRELDPARARLRAARAVLAVELARPPATVVDPAERASSAARLARAADLAASSWSELPAAWEGGLVLGGAIYLSRLRARDDRLVSAYRRWEAPLEAASELARGRREPGIVLAHAYAQLWPALSIDKRRRAVELIRNGLADAEARRELLPVWLAIAPSRERALAELPDDPAAWDDLVGIYTQARDWEGLLVAHQGRRQRLGPRLGGDLVRARGLERRGAHAEARELYLEVARRAEPSDLGRGDFARALEECPPGLAGEATRAALSAQLGRVVDACRFATCPLTKESLGRLALLAGEAEGPNAALGALYAGDVARALALARAGEGALAAGRWSDVWIALAEESAARGDGDGASAALARLERSDGERPSAWRARAALARAASDEALEHRARARLAELAALAWPAHAWDFRQGHARLELIAARPGSGFEVSVGEVATGAALVDLRLDGALVGTALARSGGLLEIAAPVASGLHLVEIAPVVGGPVLPGGVRLVELAAPVTLGPAGAR